MGQFQDETGGQSMAQWIYGKNAVMQILKSKKKVEKALVAEGAKFPEAETLLKNRRIPTQRVSRKELDRCCMDTHLSLIHI